MSDKIMSLQATLESHKKWLNGDQGGHRADLRDSALRGAALRGADLRGADLRGADLRGADLRVSELRGADLSGADLRGADLRASELRGADLRGADLRGADLRGADLHDVDLEGTMTKLFQAGEWTAIVMPDEISIGCKRYGTEKWKAFTDDEIENMHSNALAWWRENKAIILEISDSLKGMS